MTGAPLVDVVIQTAAIIAALAIILRPLRGVAQTALHFRDQWDELKDAQEDVAADLANIIERLAALEQLRPNHGKSIYDRVAKLRANQDSIMADQHEIARAVREILAYFDGAIAPPKTKGGHDDAHE